MRGPLPKPEDQRRRRNAPTISHRDLPAEGRLGPTPEVPDWVELGDEGLAWWAWAWSTPQATAWAPGHEVLVARRAGLEDDFAALAQVTSLDGLEALGEDDERAFRRLIGRLTGMAGNRLAVAREMRELDDRLGLSPKGMAVLRWRMAEEAEEAPEQVEEDDYRHLKMADSA